MATGRVLSVISAQLATGKEEGSLRSDGTPGLSMGEVLHFSPPLPKSCS